MPLRLDGYPDLNDSSTTEPKYLRLKKYLVGSLKSGDIEPGEVLPPEDQMADALRVARSTVRQALGELVREGLIRREQGRGTFVHEDVRTRLRCGLDVFALVVYDIRRSYFTSMLHGFETTASSVHNQTITCTTNNVLDRQAAVIMQLLDKDVAGVALVPVASKSTPAYHVRQIQQRGIPVVLCRRGAEGIQAPVVAVPYHQVGRLAGEAFLEQGHRRVGFFATYRSDATLRR